MGKHFTSAVEQRFAMCDTHPMSYTLSLVASLMRERTEFLFPTITLAVSLENPLTSLHCIPFSLVYNNAYYAVQYSNKILP